MLFCATSKPFLSFLQYPRILLLQNYSVKTIKNLTDTQIYAVLCCINTFFIVSLQISGGIRETGDLFYRKIDDRYL